MDAQGLTEELHAAPYKLHHIPASSMRTHTQQHGALGHIYSGYIYCTDTYTVVKRAPAQALLIHMQIHTFDATVHAGAI